MSEKKHLTVGQMQILSYPHTNWGNCSPSYYKEHNCLHTHNLATGDWEDAGTAAITQKRQLHPSQKIFPTTISKEVEPLLGPQLIMSVLASKTIAGGKDHTKGFIITGQVRRAQTLWVFLGGGISPDSSVKTCGKWNPFDNNLGDKEQYKQNMFVSLSLSLS